MSKKSNGFLEELSKTYSEVIISFLDIFNRWCFRVENLIIITIRSNFDISPNDMHTILATESYVLL